jgi:hypothetical protein
MGKQVRPLTVGIVFVLEQQKVIPIALGRMQSKVIGAVTLTHQTIYLAANGSAAEVNQ